MLTGFRVVVDTFMGVTADVDVVVVPGVAVFATVSVSSIWI